MRDVSALFCAWILVFIAMFVSCTFALIALDCHVLLPSAVQLKRRCIKSNHKKRGCIKHPHYQNIKLYSGYFSNTHRAETATLSLLAGDI